MKKVLTSLEDSEKKKKFIDGILAALNLLLHNLYVPCMRYILLLLFALIVRISFAQLVITNNNTQDKYRAVLWTRTDGLSLGKKNSMLKDINGFLWSVSPVGLNRFDGSTFKIYYPNKNIPGSINGSYSFSLVEDSLHNIWIGTNKGLSRYDIKADTFKNFSQTVLPVTSVASIIPFWATQDEVFCFEEGYEVTTYNIHSFEKKILIKLDNNRPARNNITIPHSIYDARSNSIWILTGVDSSPAGGLLQVQLSEKKTVHYEWTCFKKIPNHNHYSYGMCYDPKRKSIWINSVDGLIEFTLGDKQFHSIAGCSDVMDLNRYEILAGIALDLQGKVWLSTDARGIIIYDPLTQTVGELFSDPLLQDEVSKYNMSIYCDRDGMVWCGYLNIKGIFQLIPFSSSVSRITMDTNRTSNKSPGFFTTITEGAQGQVWIASDKGMDVFDPDTKRKKHLIKKDFAGTSGKNNATLGYNNTHQKAWLYSWSPYALYELEIPTGKYRKIPFKNISHKEIADKDIPDSYINYATASPFKNGFIFFIDKTGIFTVTNDSAIAQQVLAIPYHITNMVVADGKRIFLRLHFASTNLSYYEVDGKWVRKATALDSIEWSSMYYDTADRSYWVGGVKQLYHLDKDYKLIRRYTDKDGLPGVDVLCITKDDFGNIWFNNSDGVISRLNIITGIMTSLSEKDGYKKQAFSWLPPHFKDKNGNLYFAGVDGIDLINPRKLDLFPPSSVYLQSLEVNQKPFPFSTGVNNLKELSLEYFQNQITIETGVIDYYSRGKSSIRYKLEEINNSWQYAPSNYTIRFEKLLPGRYKLVIQASNSGNNFTGPEKILMINISPAFWNTWWFRTLAVLCLIALFYVFMRWRLRQKFSIQLERSEKERQLAELKHKATELEMQALRAQMNPHFIFNSLNSINRFILQNNKAQASEYLTKFSKLVRLILQNSQCVLISLESELESLHLYLELEALRFDHRFDFRIKVEDDLDVAALQVPPLIIQPYAENAIWHGLMHKEENGYLNIELFQQKEVLCCKIRDDGIGRKRAAELKSKSAATHKSMGMRITADRIAILQQERKMNTSIKVTDMVLAGGSCGGTEILLEIPVIYD